MKRMQKALTLVLAAALLLSLSAVFAFAAEPTITGVEVKTVPTRTVYYEGGDTFGDTLVCDVEGLVFTVSYDDGTSKDVAANDGNAAVVVVGYALGENAAMATYIENDATYTAETVVTVTVKENPVESVVITKMPTQTEYTMDDVLTADNFSFERLREVAPDEFAAILDMYGMTYDEFVANVDEAEFKGILFTEDDAILPVKSEGMEIRVTLKNGSYVDVTDAYDAIELPAEYGSYVYPITLEQISSTVTEGENTFAVVFMGKSAEFKVNVKKAAENGGGVTPDKPADKDDVKNPDIPKTGVAVSLSAAAALMLAGTAGSALLVRRRDDA